MLWSAYDVSPDNNNCTHEAMNPTAPPISLEIRKINDAQVCRVKWIEGFIIGSIGLVRPMLKRLFYQTAEEMEELLVGVVVDSISDEIDRECMYVYEFGVRFLDHVYVNKRSV